MNQIGIYQYNNIFYTGTTTQPDIISIFVKKTGEKSKSPKFFHALPLANWTGLLPVIGNMTGVVRIVNSAKAIFEIYAKMNGSETNVKWIAFKNLFQGIAEACPGCGIFLLIFYVGRTIALEVRLTKELKGKENIAGVAIDGKIILTIDLAQLAKFPTVKSDLSSQLEFFKELNLANLKRQQKPVPLQKMTEIFRKLKLAIERKN